MTVVENDAMTITRKISNIIPKLGYYNYFKSNLSSKFEQFRNLPECLQREIINVVTDDTIFDIIFNNLEILSNNYKLQIYDYNFVIKPFLKFLIKMYINYIRKSLLSEIINNTEYCYHIKIAKNIYSLINIPDIYDYNLSFRVEYYKVKTTYYAFYTVYYSENFKVSKLIEVKLTCN